MKRNLPSRQAIITLKWGKGTTFQKRLPRMDRCRSRGPLRLFGLRSRHHMASAQSKQFESMAQRLTTFASFAARLSAPVPRNAPARVL